MLVTEPSRSHKMTTDGVESTGPTLFGGQAATLEMESAAEWLRRGLPIRSPPRSYTKFKKEKRQVYTSPPPASSLEGIT